MRAVRLPRTGRWLPLILGLPLLVGAPPAGRAADPFESAPGPAPTVHPTHPTHPTRPRHTSRPPPAPEPLPAPAPLPPPQPPSYDGRYIGIMALSADTATRPNCNPAAFPMRRQMVIRNGGFIFVYNRVRDERVVGRVAGDGSVDGFVSSFSGGVRLSGRITGNDFAGTVGSAYCTYTLQLRRGG